MSVPGESVGAVPEFLPNDDRADDGRETHRVSVTVFMETKGHYRRDAVVAAEMLMRHIIHNQVGRAERQDLGLDDDGHENWRFVQHIEVDGSATDTKIIPPHCYMVGDILDVMETGMAAGNGYLWTQPTSKAYR